MSRRMPNRLCVGHASSDISLRESMMPALVLQYRIAVLGASGVGKSSIVSQFVNDQFQGENSNAMREGLQVVDYDFPGMGLSLEFRDTTCSDDYAALRRLVISSSDAFILVYSVNDQSSFEAVTQPKDEILREKMDEAYPVVIGANMMDMDDGEDQVQHVVNEMVVSVDWDDGFVATSVAEDGTSAMRVVCEVLRRVPGAPSPIEEAHAQLQKQILQQDGTRKGLNRLCRLSRRVKKLFVRQ